MMKMVMSRALALGSESTRDVEKGDDDYDDVELSHVTQCVYV